MNAQSPFNRLGQHLGRAPNSNMLRQHLRRYRVEPELCRFLLVAHGPVLPETRSQVLYRKRRDVVAGLEKGLAQAMATAGYEVMNTVRSRKDIDVTMVGQVLRSLRKRFPRLPIRE